MPRVLRPLAAAAASIALIVGGVAVAAPATADTPNCATQQEFQRVHKGMKKSRVHRIFDIRGQFAGGHAGGYTRYYPSCKARRIGGDGGAYVGYNGRTDRVVEKRWIGYR